MGRKCWVAHLFISFTFFRISLFGFLQKMKFHRSSLLFGLICLISVAGSASQSKNLLGVTPEDEKYFKSEIIKCKDGSKKFTKAQLNDDFCDCPDGTDEPGTSACPGGKFYCRNAGHVPLSLFSSKVNDGICDCCDGSDEHDGKIKCLNTCWEAGKVARDKMKKKIATYQEGVTVRKQEVEQAKQALAKDEAELSKLKNEEKILKGLVQQLKDQKEQIEKEEEKERVQKESEKITKEADNKADPVKGEAEENADEDHRKMETPHDEKLGLMEDPALDQDVAEDNDDFLVEAENDVAKNEKPLNHGVQMHTGEEKEETVAVSETGHDAGSKDSPDQEIKQDKDGSENTEELSREELGRLVASRWTGESTGQQPKEVDSAKEDDNEGHEETLESAHDEDHDGYTSETDEENQKYDEADMEDHIDEELGEEDHDDSSSSFKSDSEDEAEFSVLTTTSNRSWLDKIQETVRKILRAVNLFQTPLDKSEAAHVRKEYDESSTKLSKIQSRISSLTQKLKHDFGPEKEFYSFYGRCFENKHNKYVYKVCPFKQASQVEGHSTTRLGEWEKFEDSYRIMLFSNGDKCWNGPDRSLKVKLRCGLKNELTDVDEPSRCEYIALLSTPTLCLEEKLKELQHKLDLMDMQQPQGHDEL